MKRALAVASFLAAIILSSAGTASAADWGDITYMDAFGGPGIYTVATDGIGASNVVGDGYRPVWSPDGSGIAFASGGDYLRRVEWVDGDGTDRRTLISPSEMPSGWFVTRLSWSPNGSRLLLSVLATDDTSRGRLCIATSDGSSVELLALNAFAGDWADTGKIVAQRGRDLIRMNSSGGNVHTVPGTGDDPDSPSWSPGGARIAYARDGDIFVIDADGTDRQRLTDSGLAGWAPAWSPTGDRIVWAKEQRSGGAGYADLWIMRANGSHATRLTSTANVDEFSPDWR